MNKFFYYALTAVAIIAASATFMSCSDDDDDDDMGSTTAGVVSKDLRVSTIRVGGDYYSTDYHVYYDNDGRVKSIGRSENNPKISFSYNPNKIYFNSDLDEEKGCDVSYNKAGYITSMKRDYESSLYKASRTTNISYGSNGMMTKVEEVTNGEYNGGRTYKESGSASFTYKNDRLTRIDVSRKDDGYSWTETWVYEYDEETTVNKYQQWVHTLNPFFDESDYRLLGYLGMLGKGCKYLPYVSETNRVEDGDKDTDYDDYYYILNSNGSIDYVKGLGTTIWVIYDSEYASK